MPPSQLQYNYPEEYIEACFYSWYRAGSPSMKVADNSLSVGARKVLKSLPVAPNGARPNIKTLGSWMESRGWRERADALDAQVAMKMDKDVVKERIKILNKLSEAGEKLLEEGLNYLNNNSNPFADNPAAAVRAIVSGTDMIFKYSGAANKLAAIQDMTDAQLEKAILQLTGTERPDENNDETVDVTLEDVLDEDAEDNDT